MMALRAKGLKVPEGQQESETHCENHRLLQFQPY
jgi:hypothetical protein